MSRSRYLSVFTICLILLAAAFSTPVQAAWMQEASIIGKVVDEDGNALSQVKVEVYTSGGSLFRVTHTDSEGYFSVHHLPMDRFTLNFTKKGYVDRLVFVETDGRTEVDLEEVELRKALNLASSVVSLTASPGDKLLLPFTLTNIGDDKAVVDFSISAPEGWSTRILSQVGEVDIVSLEQHSTLSLQLEVKIPTSSIGENTLSLTALSDTNSTLHFTITVKRPEESILSCQFPEKVVAPGDTVKFQVILKNPLRDEAEFKVSAERRPSGWDVKVRNSGGEIVNYVKLGVGEFTNLIVEVRVPPDEGYGKREITFTASSPAKTEELVLSVMVARSVGEPKIDVSVEPKILQAGAESTLNIKINNTGRQDLHEVRIKLDTMQQLVLLSPSEELYIKELPEGGSTIFYVPIKVLYTPTIVPSKVTLQITYQDMSGKSYVETKALSLAVVPKTVESKLLVELSPEELQTGRENEATLKITNISAHPIEGIEVVIESSPPTKVFGSTRKYINRLDPGKEVEYSVRIYVPATLTAATTTLNAVLSYLDPELDSVKTDSFSLSVLLRGFIDLKMVDYAVVPKKPSPGQPFSVTVTLTNTGTSTAYAAYAFPITKKLPIDTFGPKSVYIGNIEVNIPTTFTLNLMLHNTTAASMEIPVMITYMDNLRSLHNVTYNLHVEISHSSAPKEKVEEGRSFIGLGEALLILIPVAAIIVGAFLLVRRFRRRG